MSDEPDNHDGFEDHATHVNMIVEQEKGRWVVYIEVTFWELDKENPLQHYRHRIQDYPTKRKAELAASWIKRAAERDIGSAPMGFQQ